MSKIQDLAASLLATLSPRTGPEGQWRGIAACQLFAKICAVLSAWRRSLDELLLFHRSPRGVSPAMVCTGLLCCVSLWGCSETTREEQPDADAPAQSAPAGVEVLPAEAAADGTLAPADLARAFSGLGVAGVRVDLIEEGEDAFLLLRIGLDAFEPRLIGGRAGGVTAAGALAEAQVVVGSGFVSGLSSLTPVGLLQVDGEVVSEMQPHGYTRVLGVRSDSLGVLGHREFHRGMYGSAIQLGPGIVERGLLDISERDLQRPRYLRAFLATCGPVAVVGVSLRPTNLYTLGRRLLAFFKSATLRCDEVVNLAGDREAVLAMGTTDKSRFAYFGHPLTAKAALVGFVARF